MKTRRELGFTLVELMVVIVILGGLIAIVGPNVWRALATSNEQQAETQMSAIGRAISMYKLDNAGKVPNDLNELTQEDEKSGEPYIESIALDPWGSEYDYRVLGRGKYRITSYGEDTQPDTDDDIVWPKSESDDR